VAEYTPPLIYRNGHSNTIAASTFLRKVYAQRISRKFRQQSESRILSLPGDIQLQGQLNTHSTEEKKSLVMILHGWLGCADSLYLLPIEIMVEHNI